MVNRTVLAYPDVQIWRLLELDAAGHASAERPAEAPLISTDTSAELFSSPSLEVWLL